MSKISNDWLLLYNGDEGFQQVAIGNKDKYAVENEFLFDKFLKLNTDDKS